MITAIIIIISALLISLIVNYVMYRMIKVQKAENKSLEKKLDSARNVAEKAIKNARDKEKMLEKHRKSLEKIQNMTAIGIIDQIYPDIKVKNYSNLEAKLRKIMEGLR